LDAAEAELIFTQQGNDLEIRMHGHLATVAALILAGVSQVRATAPRGALRAVVVLAAIGLILGMVLVVLDRIRHWMVKERGRVGGMRQWVARWACNVIGTVVVVTVFWAAGLYLWLFLQGL
jgi:hypothetical protein